jgi:hypothetical protein
MKHKITWKTAFYLTLSLALMTCFLLPEPVMARGISPDATVDQG